MKTLQFTMTLALLAGMMFSTAGFSESQAEKAYQQIKQATTSGNVESLILTLPALEQMWPKDVRGYFQSASNIAGLLYVEKNNPAAQQAMEFLYTEILNKRCPEDADMGQASTYFKGKEDVIVYYWGFENMQYNKSFLVAASRFLGEIRDWRIPNYEYKRVWHEHAVLREAGVNYAFQLTDPKDKEAYAEALRQNERDIDVERFQYLLFCADSSVTSRLLYSCKQLRHDGKLDEEFANKVADNARLNEKEREMRFPFDK